MSVTFTIQGNAWEAVKKEARGLWRPQIKKRGRGHQVVFDQIPEDAAWEFAERLDERAVQLDNGLQYALRSDAKKIRALVAETTEDS